MNNQATFHKPIVLFTGVQRLAREIHRKGMVAACLWSPNEMISSPWEIPIWIQYNPRDLMSLAEKIRSWRRRHLIKGIINRRETRVMEHAILNLMLGFDGLTLRQAVILRDKFLLRETLHKKAPHLNPPYELMDLARPKSPTTPYPFLFKPRNLFKSQLIELCQDHLDMEQITINLLGRINAASQRHGVEILPEFLLEHYVHGKEISVDAFVTDTKPLVFSPPVDVTPAVRWGIEDFHVALRRLPSHLQANEIKKVESAVEELVEALELRWVPLHVDMTIHGDNCVVLDVGPRIGGYRSEMMALAYGCPLDPMNLELSMGVTPQWSPRWQKAVAVLELFPPRNGILNGISGLDEAKRLPSFHRLVIRASPGEEVGLAKDGFRCPLFIILVHETEEVLQENLEFIRSRVKIELAPKSPP